MVSKAKRLERLKDLRYVMRNHDKLFSGVKFDIATWDRPIKTIKEIQNEHEYRGGVGDKIKNVVKKKGIIKCTTAACALGSAGLYEKFRKEGLETYIDDDGDTGVRFRHEDGYEAGARFFGIGQQEAEFLFNPQYYMNKKGEEYSDFTRSRVVTPDVVAARVDHLIKHYSIHNVELISTSYYNLPYDYKRMGLTD